MTVTETEFDNASLSELDFDPSCDCQLKFNLFGRIFVVCQCDKPRVGPRTWRAAVTKPCPARNTATAPVSTSVRGGGLDPSDLIVWITENGDDDWSIRQRPSPIPDRSA